jgi:hypothetical protein
VPPSGAGALLRDNGLQKKRATKAIVDSLLPGTIAFRVGSCGIGGATAISTISKCLALLKRSFEGRGPPCEGLWRQGGGYLSDLGENKRQIELPLVTFDTTGYPLPDQPDSRKEQEVAC